jgi:hypothetical protein
MDIVGDLSAEMDEFEDFVDNFASQMNDIISGKADLAPVPIIIEQINPPEEIQVAASAEEVKHTLKPLKKGVVDYSRWENLQCDEEDNNQIKTAPVTKQEPQKLKTLKVSKVDELRLKGNNLFASRNYKGFLFLI